MVTFGYSTNSKTAQKTEGIQNEIIDSSFSFFFSVLLFNDKAKRMIGHVNVETGFLLRMEKIRKEPILFYSLSFPGFPYADTWPVSAGTRE